MLLSSCPAWPTKGSPCASSSAPGPSPTNISRAVGRAVAKDELVAARVQRAAGAVADLVANQLRVRRRGPSAGTAAATCGGAEIGLRGWNGGFLLRS